ncbi:MAG: glycosyltransferase [Bacteroidota bacterium]
MKNKYIIITPVRDEEQFLHRTVDSVVKQSILPAKWIFVDDNSKDTTPEILKQYADQYRFIHIKTIDETTERLPGVGVMRAFEYGLRGENIHDYDYIVKLDADLEFHELFFENMFSEFSKNSNLGIASGLATEMNGKPVSNNYSGHTYGCAKIYTTKCFHDILPVEKIKSWDLIDNIKANLKGYDSKIIKSEILLHLKPMDSVIGKYKENYLKGYYSGYLRYDVIFNFLKFLKVCTETPLIVGGLMYLAGYVKSILVNDRYHNKHVTKYLRRQQRKRLLGAFTNNRSMQ